jgi:hypothetical protein
MPPPSQPDLPAIDPPPAGVPKKPGSPSLAKPPGTGPRKPDLPPLTKPLAATLKPSLPGGAEPAPTRKLLLTPASPAKPQAASADADGDGGRDAG